MRDDSDSGSGTADPSFKRCFKETRKSFILENSLTVNHWLHLMELSVQWAQSKRLQSACALAFLSIFQVVLIFDLGDLSYEAYRIGLPEWLPFLVSFINFFVIYFVYRYRSKLGVFTQARKMLMPLLYVLQEDVQPQNELFIRLDLGSSTDASKKRDVKRFEPKYRTKVCQSHFQDDWFQGDVKLCDGTRLRWSITDAVRKREVRRFNGRKHKFKTKYKVKTRLALTLTVRKDQYQFSSGARLKKEDDTKGVLSFRYLLDTKTNLKKTLSLDSLLYSISKSFQSLKPVE